jgi:NADH-quinone oxidoreductase subunit N
MSFYQLIQDVLADTLGRSLTAFRPELVLCATIVVLLLARMIDEGRRNTAFGVMVAGTLTALWFAAPWHYLTVAGSADMGPIFTGMLVFDTFSVYMRGLLLFFVLLFVTFTQTTGIPDRHNATEFYVLILGATLGMCLMVSANHMLAVFLGVEMASVPSYALAGFLRHRRLSSEAALKFAVFGGATAGVMLYGISLLVGSLGSAQIPVMAAQLAQMLADGLGPERATVLALGALMVMVGLAFKLSAVPFHFWAPDVFEGTAAEIAAFLSIASKAAALALLVRLALGFGFVEPRFETAHAGSEAKVVTVAYRGLTVENLGDEPAKNAPLSTSSSPVAVGKVTSLAAALEPARRYLVDLIGLLAVVTCTFGNLAAYGQTNMKRLLAYSTIAHAGYMMMPVAAAVSMSGTDPAGARAAVASLGFYVGIYLFMNLGAFAGVAFLRNALGSERIDDYAGLVGRSPGLAVSLTIVLFSLVGLPPLAGFSGKFAMFASVADARLWALLVIGVLNTVLSLFYYLRVVRVMMLLPEPAGRPTATLPLTSVAGAYTFVLALPLLILGVWWNGLYVWAAAAASSLLL